MGKNKNLHLARRTKNDEFYTQLEDIEKELTYYKEQFRDKIVYCNCDGLSSNFFMYFSLNYEALGLKELICTRYNPNGKGKKYEYYGDKEQILTSDLEGDGDFRSDECIELIKKCDIVCTNPPFSLFREYITQLIKYSKKFLVIGNINAISYKEVFPLIKENKVWLGVSLNATKCTFITNEDYDGKNTFYENGIKYAKVNNAVWFTNFDHIKRHEELLLYKKYNIEEYPKYDNYDAIEVGKVTKIPMDYDGIMGVPITFLTKYNPEQFEIIDARDSALNEKQKNKNTFLIKDADSAIDGKPKYVRLCIRKKKITHHLR